VTAGHAACATCGGSLTESDRFCRSCGASVASTSGSPAATTPAATTPAGPAASEPAAAPSGGSIVDAMAAVGTSGVKAPSGPGSSGPPFMAPSQQPSAWTSPVGRGAGQPGRGPGGGASGGVRRVGRGALGCLTILIGLGVLGVIGATLEDSGATPRPSASAPHGTPTPRPTAITPGATAIAPVAPETEPAGPRPVELAEALASGLVVMTADGRNLQQLELSLDSLADESLTVVVPAGSLFKPGASGTQSMLVISAAWVILEPGAHSDVTLDVACAAMHRDTPGSGDSFTLATKPIKADLAKLLATPGFPAAGFRVQQFAIWTITNDPARDGYVGLGTFGVGSGPSDAEIREIKALFREAGIDTGSYRALR
jgi:hypothetical protein